MIGVIITGHSKFPSGTLSALELISGAQDYVSAIDFEGAMSPTDLFDQLKETYLAFNKHCSNVVILCDIVGGTPFNQAAKLSVEYDNIDVFSGISLQALLEPMINKEQGISEFSRLLIESSKMGILHFNKEIS
ncbi:hypothetical protein ACS127_00525 [Amphibacillus sp. Q70]|uniref:PTS sugar transporter subunit IIA domain-containing protein n=1 Tax=Amphibacillus sp. Q70 TaxID=3453416 RepID=UPI003F871821